MHSNLDQEIRIDVPKRVYQYGVWHQNPWIRFGASWVPTTGQRTRGAQGGTPERGVVPFNARRRRAFEGLVILCQYHPCRPLVGTRASSPHIPRFLKHFGNPPDDFWQFPVSLARRDIRPRWPRCHARHRRLLLPLRLQCQLWIRWASVSPVD